uniref:Uncharacterized protein n=1 Tax=Physcomitrium patens TaxID=3218 RepID=A0A2K1ICW7_PHYPA|nr:hypothetical protein PHYPA_030604 [Physcomitrium patens]
MGGLCEFGKISELGYQLLCCHSSGRVNSEGLFGQHRRSRKCVQREDVQTLNESDIYHRITLFSWMIVDPIGRRWQIWKENILAPTSYHR